MRKNGKMQRVVMGILATMFVASLVLAVVSHAAYAAPPTPPHPLTYCWDEYKWSDCMSTYYCAPYPGPTRFLFKRQCCFVPTYGVVCGEWRSTGVGRCGC